MATTSTMEQLLRVLQHFTPEPHVKGVYRFKVVSTSSSDDNTSEGAPHSSGLHIKQLVHEDEVRVERSIMREIQPPHYINIIPWGHQQHALIMRSLDSIHGHCGYKIAKEVLEQLELLHSKGWVHCDVKMANIRYDPVARKALLIDYGLAERCNQAVRRSYGTPQYCGIDALNGRATARSDVEALCYSLFEHAGNILPWDSDIEDSSSGLSSDSTDAILDRRKYEGIQSYDITTKDPKNKEFSHAILAVLRHLRSAYQPKERIIYKVIHEILAESQARAMRML